jgi:mannosylglycerate hydrolase MGH1-like protein
MTLDGAEVKRRALELLTAHWDEERGHTYPNLLTYPHQWLWDSCFAAICWDAVGRPENGLRELTNVLASQFDDGFVPHIRYAGRGSGRGPRSDVSSYTQPPIFAHTARVLSASTTVPEALLTRIERALDWLWTARRTPDGLLFVVHPWETGVDDSPRWDTWAADFLGFADWTAVEWTRASFTRLDEYLVDQTIFNADGQAVGSRVFQCAPAAFNALSAHAAREYAALTGDAAWAQRATELAAVMDELMWNAETGLWSDVPIIGGGEDRHVPTLDGVLPALVTADAAKAARAVDQLASPQRFAAPFGVAVVARDHPACDPAGYWRGGAWMQMNYLARLTAARWDRTDIVDDIAAVSIAAIERTRFAEYWNIETGQGLGAIPLTWSALVATMVARPARASAPFR